MRGLVRWTLPVLSVLSFVVACQGSSKDDGAPQAPVTTTGSTAPPPVQSTEWVGFHAEIPIAPDDFHPLAAGLIGGDAQAKKLIGDREVEPGVFVGAAADPTTPDQVLLTISFDDGTPTRKKLAVAPASFQLGTMFVATTDAAIAKMKADAAVKPDSAESFYLEYRVVSVNGGRLSFGIRGDRGNFSLVLDIATRRTTIDPGKIGTAADIGDPYDTIAGTVWFHMSKDDFDYFSDHAYGKGATSRQNFKDFALVPHEWLRLNVDPHLDQQFVNVGFEVLGLDGKRLQVAKAPASILAGKVFQSMVDRAMTTMIHQEEAKAGSSTPWRVPFYYDAPKDGGVVQVIAEGTGGLFDIAYAIESPRHVLRDVQFLAYDPVQLPAEDPLANATCDKLGDPSIVLAASGTLDMTFKASDTVKKSADLKGPLKGKVYCSVYAAKDVKVDGPTKDAISIQDFVLDNADLEDGAPAPTYSSKPLHAGEYQVLCFLDMNGDGQANPGDPVTLPIGSYPVACNKNPSTIELAILYPKN